MMLQLTLYLMACLLVSHSQISLVWGLSNDAQAPKAGLNELQFPEEALLSNPGSVYALTPGLVPKPRVKGTVTYLEPLVVVMGGYDTDGALMDDIHFYDTRLRKWSGGILKRSCCYHEETVVELSGATENSAPRDKAGFEGDLPAARAEHAACSHNGILFVFGGVLEHYSLSNDFYSYDPVALQWSLIDRYGGQGPTRRAGHSLMTDFETDSVILFGGRANLAGRMVGLADVWVYTISSRKWEWASSTAGRSTEPNPAGRQHAATAIVASTLFVVGGINPTSDLIFNDVWAFDLSLKVWKLVAANSGQGVGFAPPPLYHSTLLPVTDLKGPNATEFQHASLLLFGGVGGGGSCGSPSCGQSETSLGQVYRLPIAFDAYDVDASGSESSQAPQFQRNANAGLSGIDGVGFDASSGVMDVAKWRLSLDNAKWSFARLSDSSDDSLLHGRPNAHGRRADDPLGSGAGGGGALGRGRLLKTYAMEAACFDPKRGLFYELGGIQAVPISMAKAEQMAVELTGPSLLETGGEYQGPGDDTGVAGNIDFLKVDAPDAPLWDVHAQEHLHTMAQLPVNSPWVFSDAFERHQPQVNGSLRFLHSFRTYHVSAFENLVLQITDDQGTVP